MYQPHGRPADIFSLGTHQPPVLQTNDLDDLLSDLLSCQV